MQLHVTGLSMSVINPKGMQRRFYRHFMALQSHSTVIYTQTGTASRPTESPLSMQPRMSMPWENRSETSLVLEL